MPAILRRIEFAEISVTILSIEHISRVRVGWRLAKSAQNLSRLRFFIDRGESPSEMRQLNAEPLTIGDLPEYVDFTANLKDLNKIYYYRVRAVEYEGDTPVQTFTSKETTWDGDLDLVGIYVVDEHLFAMRWVFGVPAMVYKKRREGTNCPECWDQVLKRVTKSNCQTCYGTGRIGGFYPPIDVWMSFEPDPRVEQVTEWGKRQPTQTDIMFTNYPLLNNDDVILELKPGRFWKVSNVRGPEKNRTVMLQFARLDAINPSDVEQRLDVPEARKLALLAEAEKREKQREF
jgi:hypothetical protein